MESNFLVYQDFIKFTTIFAHYFISKTEKIKKKLFKGFVTVTVK